MKLSYIIILIFALAFAWGLFFTCGLDFFWEDFEFFHLDKEQYPIDSNFSSRCISGIKVLGNCFKDFFTPRRLFQAGFGANYIDRPYLFHTDELLGVIFGDRAILYRIFRVLVLAVNTCLLFLLINRKSLKLAIAGVFLYITSAELWALLAYSSDIGIYAQLAEFISILLFLSLLNKKTVEKKYLWLYYFFIFLASNYAIFAKCNGRYLAVIFILTFIFFRRKELKFHAPMLTLLLFLQIPLLGYLKKFFTGLPVSPIHIASHNTRTVSESLRNIFVNLSHPQNAIGNLLLVLVGVVILIHILSIIFKKSSRFFENVDIQAGKDLREQVFIFMLWFIFSFMMIAVSRSFSYSGPYDWVKMEISFFIGPFIIFLCYYAYMIFSRLRMPFKKVFISFCLILMAVQLLLNLPRIKRFRAGWGNYFCAWKNTEKYIDSISNNAMVYTHSEMFYKPFVFRNSNNKVINNLAGTNNLAFIEKVFKDKGFSYVFFASRNGVKFEGKSEKVILKGVVFIDGDSGGLYDRLKAMIGMRPYPVICVQRLHIKGEKEGIGK